MYRLLIIDDEPYIVNWLFELFHQNQKLELDIYRANSASEALELLKRAKIDIVMTDINMPNKSGLELFQEIRQHWPMCKVIFLTAYSEFEYIQTANKFGATYLLKTETDDEIIKAVEKAVNEIDDIIKQDELIKNAKSRMEMTLPFMQREFLLGIIQNDDEVKIKQDQLDELNIDLDADNDLLVLIGRIDNWYLTRHINERSKQLAIIQAIAQNFFSPMLKYACIHLDNSILVWLIQPQKNMRDDLNVSINWEDCIMFVKGTLESIQTQYNRNMDNTCSFVISSNPSPWQNLSQEVLSVLKLMNYNCSYNKEMIITKIQSDVDTNSQYEYYLRQVSLWLNKLSILEAYLENGQRDEFYGLFHEMKEKLIPIINIHSNLRQEVYFSIYLKFLTYINKYEAHIEKPTVLSELTNLINVNANLSSEEIFNNFDQIADMIFNYKKDYIENEKNTLIFKLNDYIRNNLDNDVSLVKLAELVYLNPAYLSRIYKNITGINLSTFINDCRMQKAKNLLMERNVKVYEIASAVGFESDAYFIRMFKKATNMTPQEYRDKQ